MSMDRSELLTEALQLSPSDRAALAADLIGSLDEAEEPDATIEAEWRAEIARRLAEVEAGTAKLIPAAEVLAQVRDVIRRARAKAS